MDLYLSFHPYLAAAQGEGTDWFASVFKLMVLLVSAPAWLPVLKELWKEVNDSLGEEGGVFGETPDQATAQSIGWQRNRDEKSLVSVLMADRGKAERAARQGRKGGRGTITKSSRSTAPRKRTF